MANITTMTRQRMQKYVDNVVGVWDDTLLHLLDALSASTEAINGEHVDGALMDLLEYLEQTKAAIKAAIEGKGVTVPDNASFRDYAALIGQIGSGLVVLPTVSTYKEV